MPGMLRWTLGGLPRLRGDGWGGSRCGAIDDAVNDFLAVWPLPENAERLWLFTSGDVQTFIAYERHAIVSRDSIRRRLGKHKEVRKFGSSHWINFFGAFEVKSSRRGARRPPPREVLDARGPRARVPKG